MTGHLIGIDRTLKAHRQTCEEVILKVAELGDGAGGDVAGGPIETTRVLGTLRQWCGDEIARIVSAAARLQHQAQQKLAPPDTPRRVWWVTEKSLRQATPWQVARLKAAWFADAPVHDLCCGIGGDSIQLAAHGEVTSVDIDPIVAAMVEANLDLAGYLGTQAQVVCADVTAQDLPKSASLHVDPDRRAEQRRRSDPNAFQPSWPQVSQMVADSAAAVVKLAPASEIPEGGIPASEFHRCWISLSGSVREQSLLWGSVIDRAGQSRGERSAMVMRSDGTATWFSPDAAVTLPTPDTWKGSPEVLIDPNAAIRAAGLTEAFANRYELGLLSGPAGFLAGDIDATQYHDSVGSLAAVGRVQWWGTCDDRKLRKEFRARGVFPETIKVRGVDQDPAVLFKRYRHCGDRPVTLWIGRHGKRVFAAITD